VWEVFSHEKKFMAPRRYKETNKCQLGGQNLDSQSSRLKLGTASSGRICGIGGTAPYGTVKPKTS
jgi:hypothetical protein